MGVCTSGMRGGGLSLIGLAMPALRVESDNTIQLFGCKEHLQCEKRIRNFDETVDYGSA